MALAFMLVPVSACYTGVGVGPTVGYAAGRGPSLGWGVQGSTSLVAVEVGQSWRRAPEASDRVVSYVAASPFLTSLDLQRLPDGNDGVAAGGLLGLGLSASGDVGLIDGLSVGYARGLGGEFCPGGTSWMGSISLGIRTFGEVSEVYLAPKLHVVTDCPYKSRDDGLF